jgi:hypothetical protein
MPVREVVSLMMILLVYYLGDVKTRGPCGDTECPPSGPDQNVPNEPSLGGAVPAGNPPTAQGARCGAGRFAPPLVSPWRSSNTMF